MYVDPEGHMIATSLADAVSAMAEHELAEHFGYDCSHCQALEAAQEEGSP